MTQSRIRRLAMALAVTATAWAAVPAQAYLYWIMPDFSGEAVKGNEPGIGQTLPGANAKELQAHLLWNMRAGLNVAALQCQFSPALMTVSNYNALLFNHSKELNDAFVTLSGYFKRVNPKGWQTTLDQYTTRTYNGFSTLHAQLGFCETAGVIGREAIGEPKGRLYRVAQDRMRMFRNSLVYRPDPIYSLRTGFAPMVPGPAAACTDRKGRATSC